MEVVLYWQDSQGNVLAIKPDLTDTSLVKLSDDGLMLSITMDDATMKKVRPMLTSVDTVGLADSLKYGYAKASDDFSYASCCVSAKCTNIPLAWSMPETVMRLQPTPSLCWPAS